MERMIKEKDIVLYEIYLKNEEKSQNTILKYIRDIKRLKLYLNNKRINKEVLITYKNNLIQDGYAISSVNSMIASINSYILFKNWNDLRLKSIRVQNKIFRREDKELTRNDYIRLINKTKEINNERLNLLIQTICATGIRVGEIKYITIEGIMQGEVTILSKGKNRSIFIVKKLRSKLLKYARKNKILKGPIFITKNGNVLNRSNIWRDLKKLCLISNINSTKVFPHNLRHLFARTFYDKEKDIAKLADILGHSSINTTRIYIISTSTQHRRCMENMKLVI